ncbi:unnamed protein product [Lactuca saligna]|uniref:Major facilitator superfamily (MFS) profile domain-containing protein n=1 Tax=Lactuca saligna TaxID=75948 RepID=A0AA36E706_LACSI|nr:unnamed protein product [Lactuca saligna]
MHRFGWRHLLGVSTLPYLLALVYYGLVKQPPRHQFHTQGRFSILVTNTVKVTAMSIEGQVSGCVQFHFGYSLPQSIRTTICFEESGTCGMPSIHMNMFITSFAELPGLALASLILVKVGRRISMEIMIIAGLILLLPLVVHQNTITTTAYLFGARVFISATFIVSQICAPEGYLLCVCLSNFRATGVGVAMTLGKIVGIVCPLIAAGIGSGCHQTLPLIMFVVTTLLLGLSVVLLPFETRGRLLQDNIDSPLKHKLLPY